MSSSSQTTTAYVGVEYDSVKVGRRVTAVGGDEGKRADCRKAETQSALACSIRAFLDML